MREPTERRERPNRRILSVSETARSARVLLEERFALVWVEGEVSNLRRPGSGHWYFTLKDERAQLKCAMFASRNRLVRSPIADGARIEVWLDKRMNDAGLLRLMVSDPLAMNMSNTLGYLRGELKQTGKTLSPKGRKRVPFGKRVLEISPVKKAMLAIYNKIFNWYYS